MYDGTKYLQVCISTLQAKQFEDRSAREVIQATVHSRRNITISKYV